MQKKRQGAPFSKLTTLLGRGGEGSIDPNGWMPSGLASLVPTRFSISGPAMLDVIRICLFCLFVFFPSAFRQSRGARERDRECRLVAHDDVYPNVDIPNGILRIKKKKN